MPNSPLLQSPVTTVVTDADKSPDLEGFEQDLMRLTASSGSTRLSIVDSAPMGRMSTPVDFDSAFARYHGKPMAAHA